jgi:hypothetical protein
MIAGACRTALADARASLWDVSARVQRAPLYRRHGKAVCKRRNAPKARLALRVAAQKAPHCGPLLVAHLEAPVALPRAAHKRLLGPSAYAKPVRQSLSWDRSKAFTVSKRLVDPTALAAVALLSAGGLPIDFDKCLCPFTDFGCAVPGFVQRGADAKAVRAGGEIAG